MRRALVLVGQLHTIPESRYAAAARDEQVSVWHWRPVQVAVADLYDMVQNTLAAMVGVKAPEGSAYPRPRFVVDEDPSRPMTIAEFDVGDFMRQISN